MQTNVRDAYGEGPLPRRGLHSPKENQQRPISFSGKLSSHEFPQHLWHKAFNPCAILEVKREKPKVILRQLSRPYMIQIVLNLAQGCFGDFDVAGFPLVLTKLPEWSHVVHSMAEGVVVLVHQPKALQRKRQTTLSDTRLLHTKCWCMEHAGRTCSDGQTPYPISQIRHFLLFL